MKIVDAFIFYNELDLLYYRLSILYDIVDYFVIVESVITFTGNTKKLYYKENEEIFSKFKDKIIHIVDNGDFENENKNPWINESHQRNYINEGIKQIELEPNDKIIISDIDEIPDPSSIKRIKEAEQIFNILCLDQDLYYYNLTCKLSLAWNYSKIVSYNAYKNMYNSIPEKCRGSTIIDGSISPGGWHLSYFGDSKFIRNKIENFSHQEFNNDFYKNEETIKNNISNCSDVYMRPDINIVKIPISENKYLPPQYEIYLKNYFG